MNDNQADKAVCLAIRSTAIENGCKFVILRGIMERNRFFSTFTIDKDPTLLEDGTVAYEIIGFAKTVEEAQTKLFGRSFTHLR